MGLCALAFHRVIRAGIGIKPGPAALAPVRGALIDTDGARALHDLGGTVGTLIIRFDCD
jgi:hypothetical protein